MVPQQSTSLMTKMWVWFEIGSPQAAAPDTTGTFKRGLMVLSQTHASTCLVVNPRMTNSLPRQQVSASESVLLADLVPGFGELALLDADAEDEFVNWANEWTAFTPSHSLQPPSFRVCKSQPPMIDEGRPGGLAFCWVILEMTLLASLICNMIDLTM